MPRGKDDITDDDRDQNRFDSTHLSRRRWLSVAGGTLVGGVLASGAASAQSLSNTIVFDGTGSRGKSNYEFGVTESVEPLDDVGQIEQRDTIEGTYVRGAVHRDVDAYQFSGALSSLDVSGDAEVSITYGDGGGVEADRLQLVAAEGSSVNYSFTTSDRIVKVTDGDHAANDADEVTENDDGTWTVSGSTADGTGDTFDFWGDVESFDPLDGDFTVFRNGEETTGYEIAGQKAPDEDRQHSYSFEGTGSEPADYYLEVEDGGNTIASTVDGAVVEDQFHWISDDGTKAAGRVDPDERHAYEFDTLVVDVTIDGEADAYVDGRPSNVSRYPLSGASGDDWKGGFPWQEEERDSSEEEEEEDTEVTEIDVEFTVTSLDDVDGVEFSVHVENEPQKLLSMDESRLVAEDSDTITRQEDDTWVVEGSTGTASGAPPAYGDSFEWTGPSDTYGILGFEATLSPSEYTVLVNGEEVDPTEFPAFDAPGEGEPSEPVDTVPSTQLGGGAGYENVVTEADADVVVSSRSELESEVSSASSGDVVFVDPSASININSARIDVPDGVTVASNRGVDGSSGAELYQTDEDAYPGFYVGDARITGIEFTGPKEGTLSSGGWPGRPIEVEGPAEIDNCEMHGMERHAVLVEDNAGGEAHVHHNVFYDNRGNSMGYSVAVARGGGCPTVEYNYFENDRHSVTTDGTPGTGFICQYNHFGPITHRWPVDVHDWDRDSSVGSSEVVIRHNVFEAVEEEYGGNPDAVDCDGSPEDRGEIYGNWFFLGSEGEALDISSSAYECRDNFYGPNASSFEEIIPDYDGSWNSALSY